MVKRFKNWLYWTFGDAVLWIAVLVMCILTAGIPLACLLEILEGW